MFLSLSRPFSFLGSLRYKLLLRLIWTTTFCVRHHFDNTGHFLYISYIVASCDYTLTIDIDDEITHHFAAAHFSQRSKHVANELYKLS